MSLAVLVVLEFLLLVGAELEVIGDLLGNFRALGLYMLITRRRKLRLLPTLSL